jgi:hypothetical protein
MPGLDNGTDDYWLNESIKDIEFEDEYSIDDLCIK